MTERIHLVVATPCFGGQVSSIYASSIFKLQSAMRSKSNAEFKVLLRDGDALITRARANLMTQFLDDPTTTHFLFVDADIGFTPKQVFRPDRIRPRRGRRPLSDQARQLGEGAAGDREQQAERAGVLARLRAGDQRSRSCRGCRRLYPRALRRHRFPDDPTSRVREDCARPILRCNSSASIRSMRWPAARIDLPCSNA